MVACAYNLTDEPTTASRTHANDARNATTVTANDAAAAAFQDAWAAHHRELLGYLRLALPNPTAAEDARQEIFLRAWRAWDSYDGSRASVRTWLYAITRNHVIDLHRRRRLTVVGDPEARLASLVQEHVDDPAQTIADRALVQALLATLDPIDARTLVALHVEGRSSVEVGRDLGVSDSTVRTRAARALRQLRDQLSDLRDPELLATKDPS